MDATPSDIASALIVIGGAVLWLILRAKIDAKFSADVETHKRDVRVEGVEALARIQATLDRDLDTHRNTLVRESGEALAKLNADLRIEAGKRERRFEVQHANRVEALSGLYGRLSAIKREIETFRLYARAHQTLKDREKAEELAGKTDTSDLGNACKGCLEYLDEPSPLHLNPDLWDRVEDAVEGVSNDTTDRLSDMFWRPETPALEHERVAYEKSASK